jgi:hypothetical protein
MIISKQFYAFVPLILACGMSVLAQPGIEWQRTPGGSGTEELQQIHRTSDGGYIAIGRTDSNDGDITGSHGGDDLWVVKLDSLGILQWQRALGGSGSDQGYAVQQTPDGGYILAGYSDSNDGDVTGNHGGADFWVVKLDGPGNTQWQKSLGGTGSDFAFDIKLVTGGGYIVAGQCNSIDGDVSGNHGDWDFWVVKLDNAGNILWQNSYGGSDTDHAYRLLETQEGGYIVAGRSSSDDGDVNGGQGMADFWVVKLSISGALQWEKTYGGDGVDIGRSIQQTPDKGYIIAGWTEMLRAITAFLITGC